MSGLSLVEGVQRRDLAELLWQVAEKRSCDEVVIRYDCGHAIRADTWAPALPKTKEYGISEPERRRFMQHSLFVLTREPGAPKVQITVPEGRCRHCGRGQRQALICGVLTMELTDAATARLDAMGGKPVAFPRRLELPMSSHTFLAAMGKVCRLPENITLPPLFHSGSASCKAFDGPPLSREDIRQWTRKEVEDDLRSEVTTYVLLTTLAFLLVASKCLYVWARHLSPLSPTGFFSSEGLREVAALALGGVANSSAGEPGGGAGELGNLLSAGDMERAIANSSWALSVLTVAVHRAFGPSPAELAVGGHGSALWSNLLHPFWVLSCVVLAPAVWVLDLVLAVPRFLVLHVCDPVVRGLLWEPCGWFLRGSVEFARQLVILLVRGAFLRPTLALSQVPMTNPIAVAALISLVVAALSAKQPPSLGLLNVWGDLPNVELFRGLRSAVMRSRSLGPLVQRLRLWSLRGKEGRPRGGSFRGIPAARGAKERFHTDRYGGKEKAEPTGRTDKVQAGRQEGKTPPHAAPQPSAPACFVCLDRPSRYILEPCGHRVVCEDCAVQLVEDAARKRSMSEGGLHHSSERAGGACPSCGMAITRAMRLFS